MADISYTEIEVGPSLTPFVKRFWKYTNPKAYSQNYTILPDGYFDLVVKITNGAIYNISLFGICTKEIEVTLPSEATIMGVCFKPLSAEAILNRSIANIINASEMLPDDFWNINNIPFEDFNFWTDKVTVQMLSSLNNNKTIDNRKINIFDLLFQQSSFSSVKALSSKVFWNTRQVNRYFKNQLGISLKAYINILRCFASYSDIREGELSPGLAFYDQSHFIKEIRKHTGVSPTELYKNKNDRFLQFSTLPEA